MNPQVPDVENKKPAQPEWDRVAATPEFKELIATKKVFIIPTMLLFLGYYFALLLLAGYAPQFMSTRVFPVVNVAYIFAISVFFAGWVVIVLYAKFARRCDDVAKGVLDIPGNLDAER